MAHIIRIELPEWIWHNTTLEEYTSIMSACDKEALKAFYKILDSIYEQRKANEQLESEGQMALC